MKSSTCVVAVDPGETTGWCAVRLPDFEATAGQVKDVDALTRVLEAHRPRVVVIEDFRLQPERAKSFSRRQLPTSEVIGAVAAWCGRNWVELVRQPASMKTIVTRELLERLGLWSLTGRMPHARDAARHLVVWLLREKREETAARLSIAEMIPRPRVPRRAAVETG
jgi:hypothetical protein